MMTPEEHEAYRVLGLPPEAPSREVKAQFRRLAKQFHPDLNPGSEWHQEQFRRLHAAYETLDAARRAAALAAPPFALEASPAGPSERAWVTVGEVAHRVSPPFGSEVAPASRRRRAGRRVPRAGKITWGLAAVALFLLVIVVAGPHNGGGTFAASGFAPQTPMPSATPGALPLVVLLPVTDTPTPFQSGAGGLAAPQASSASALPALQSSAFGAVPPAAGPQAASHAEFSVDAKYTQVDPAYTAVDPQYTTVNVQAMVGGQNLGVDPKNTGIDPKIVRP